VKRNNLSPTPPNATWETVLSIMDAYIKFDFENALQYFSDEIIPFQANSAPSQTDMNKII
jgi:hypothetical protein